MRTLAVSMLVLAGAALDFAQEPAGSKIQRRYNFTYNDALPQKTPQEALTSLVKALDSNRLDYSVAQLVDPEFVDGRVNYYVKMISEGAEDNKTLLAFDKVVGDVRKHFREDPVLEREIRFFAKQGKWEEAGDKATATWQGSTRKITMKKVEDRWFMEDKQK